jgi:hypothetical protein
LEIPRLERVLRRQRAQSQEQREQSAIGMAARVETVRRKLYAMTPEERAAHNAKRDKEMKEWQDWKGTDHNPDAESIKAEWRRLRETNPRAGGVGVDHLLGVETPRDLLWRIPSSRSSQTRSGTEYARAKASNSPRLGSQE